MIKCKIENIKERNNRKKKCKYQRMNIEKLINNFILYLFHF